MVLSAWLVAMAAALLILGAVTTWSWLHAGVGLDAMFLVVWWMSVVWIIGAFLLRIASDVEVTTTELRWRTPLRQGTVPLHALRAVRTVIPFFPFWAVAVKTDDGARVWLMTEPASAQLVDHLRAVAPQLEVSWVARHMRGSLGMHSYTRVG
jgi:hypothetical protein